MRVLVACETSGEVRRAFQRRGHTAFSCDVLPSDDDAGGWHIEADVFEAIRRGVAEWGRWDVVVAHPPCQFLSVSGNRWHARSRQRTDAADFVRQLADVLTRDARAWAIENPVGALSTLWRRPDQWVQPWQFGHPESKKTGLWLHGLPRLRPTDVLPVPARGYWANQTPSGQNRLGPSPGRAKARARTYRGIAEAMADQWAGEARRGD